MNPTALLAETVQQIRWHDMPPAWVVVMLLVPMAVAIGWWSYRRESEVPARARLVLGGLRTVAVLLFLLLVAGPHAEVSETQKLRSHLLVLLDNSASMSTVDGYEPEDARALSAASGLPPEAVASRTRLELARAVLTHDEHELLERLATDFRLHVFTFGSQLTPLVSVGDSSQGADAPGEESPATRITKRMAEVEAVAPSTRLGQAVSMALDTFTLRDERVAGVVVLTDGQQNGGAVTPVQAGRRAASQHVPVYAVGVGDPRSPRNIQVSNLRAKEVVLAKDTALFEFTVRAKGFERRAVPVEIQEVGPEGEPVGSPYRVDPPEIRLTGGEGEDKDEQKIRVAYRFERAGTYLLRVGIPVQDEEKIKSDNYALHTIRVIDRKIKVLYVEGLPRYEYQFLSTALTRDYQTLLAHAMLLDADPGTPQRATRVPQWHSLDHTRGLPDREALFEYDVIVLGDADWRRFAASTKDADAALENLREFVEKGGGLVFVAGTQNNPTKYQRTPLEEVLPIVIDRDAERADVRESEPLRTSGYPFRMTAEGERSPLLNITGEIESSKEKWETDPDWLQHWSYPALRPKTGARVLLESGHPSHRNKFGARPLVATMLYGRGRTLFIGTDELWRIRKYVGDRYYYRFYGEAVRFLATYKLLGGNKRFKIITDRDKYTLDDTVRITLDVLDADYEPSKEESHTVSLDQPGARPGSRETVVLEIPRLTGEPGAYSLPIVPTRPGEYRLSAQTDDENDEQPEKVFQVVQSTLEGRDLLLDETALRDMAAASEGGAYLNLWEVPEKLTPRSVQTEVTVNARTRELWDNAWALAAAVTLLAAEWLLRKRWHLV